MVDFEIYIGQYKTELQDKTFIEHKGQKLAVVRPYVGIQAGIEFTSDPNESVDDRVTIVTVDQKNAFWPCIIRLSNGEARQLITYLQGALKHRNYIKGNDVQYSEVVEP